MEFNDRGNINMQGIVPIELDNFKDFFVDNLENYQRRNNIFNNFIKLLDNPGLTNIKSQFTRVWVDGSFCTNKEMPGDIDFVLLFKADSNNFDKSSIIVNQLSQLGFQSIAKDFDCHIFIIMDNDTLEEDSYYNEDFIEVKPTLEKNFSYWKNFFLTDREENPKPMFEMKFEGGQLI